MSFPGHIKFWAFPECRSLEAGGTVGCLTGFMRTGACSVAKRRCGCVLKEGAVGLACLVVLVVSEGWVWLC